jgi:phytoene dehydrogenase-like protein
MKQIVIIGAGLGGLTAGALLAKRGYKVTILEQHTVVGGCATTFRRGGGYTCEVGLHEMDAAFGEGKNEIFESLGVYDNVAFVQPDTFYHIATDEIDFTMPHDRKKARESLILSFPHEQKAIHKYFVLLEAISREFERLTVASWWEYLAFPFVFKSILRYRTASTKGVMDKLFRDDKLKLILNANVGYYSDKIENLSFLLHAIAQNSYYSGGGWYIKGGSQKLSDYLASVIRQYNGEVITRANVTHIADHTVTYVRKKQTITLKSDSLISNLSPASTYRLAGIPYQEKRQSASSILTIYIGFKHNLKTIYGTRPYASFFFKGIQNIEEYDAMIDADIQERGFVFTDYSQIDSGLTDDPGKSFGAILTTDFLEDWQDLSKAAYAQKKERVLEHFLDQLSLEYPNIQEHIAFAEVATSKTIQRYIKTPNGTAYGFAPTPKQFFRIPQVRSKRMKNLYFVGAWVMGGGFSPAIISGKICYEEVMKR